MTTEQVARPARRITARGIGWTSLVVVFVIALLRLAGGLLHVTLLTSVASSWIEMKAITMVCLLFSVGALTLIYLRPADRRRSIGAACLGGVVALVGLATIADYVSQLATGQVSALTQVSFLRLILAADTRMALITAVVFTLLGFALVLLAAGGRRAAHVAHALTFPAAILTYLVPLSYLLGVQSMSAVLGMPMALNTGIAFLFICLAVFCARTDTWLMKSLTGDGLGAFMARRLLPALMATPLVVGWLRLQGERTGLFSSEVGVALVAATYTILFVVLVWLAARAANRSDARRREAELATRESEERLNRAQEIAHLGSWQLDLVTNRLTWSDEVYRIFGLKPQEFGATYEAFLAAVHPDDRAAVDAAYTNSVRENRDGYEIEHRVVRKDTGEVRIVQERCRHSRDASGRIVRSVGMVHDITERKQADIELRESEEKFAKAFRSAPYALSLTRLQDGQVIDVNESFCEISGYARDEVVGRAAAELQIWVNPADRSSVLEELSRTGRIRNKEFQFRIKNGEVVVGLYSAEIIQVANQPAMLSSISDITERKRAEAELRESEARLHHALDAGGMGSWGLDTRTGKAWRSLRHDQIFGYKELLPEWTYQMFLDHVLPEDLNEVDEKFGRALANHTEWEFECRIRRADGEVRWIWAQGRPRLDVNGKVVAMVGLVADVTGRKQAEDALRVSRERQAILADTAAALLSTSRPQELVEELCRRVMEHLDCQIFVNFLVDEPSHRLRLNACAGVPPKKVKLIEWLDFGQAVCGAVAESGKPIAVDHIQSVPDPRATLVKSLGADAYCCHPLLSQGKVIGTLSFGTTTRPAFADEERAMMKAVADLVSMAMERVRGEETLRASEERLRKLYSAMSEGLALHQMVYDDSGKATDYRIVDVNPAFEAITGISRADATGRLASELYGTGAPPYMDIYAKVADAGEPTEFETEFAPMAKSFHISVFSPGKGVFATVFSDITARREAEHRLAEQATMLASANDAIIGYDTGYCVTFWNRSAELMYGYSEAEAMGRVSTDLFHPVYIGGTREQMVERIAADGHIEVESIRTARDGRQLSIEAHVIALRDDQGTITGYVSVDRDITERKRAEAELCEAKETLEVKVKERTAELTAEIEERKRAEKRLTAASQYARSLIESSLDPLVTINAEGRITDVNEATVKVTGATRVELIGTDFSEYFTEPENARAGYQRAFAQGFVTDYPLTICSRDGRLTDVLYNASVYRDAKGSVIGVFAAARDVTVQMQASQYARSLIEASPDPLVTISAEGKITDVNEATVNVTGCAREQLIGTDFSDYFTEPEKARAGYQRVFADGFVIDYPLTICSRDGRLTDVLYNASVYRDTRGHVTGVFAAARDVTARKRAEEALKKAYDTLEEKVAERTAELKRSNEELEQFAYVASHDLQEPLRMVASYVQLLGQRYKGQLDEKADRYIAYASEGAIRMHRLVNDLLSLSRVGTRTTPMLPVRLDRIVSQARDNLATAIYQSGAEVEVGPLPEVSGDQTQLIQLFQNLLDNAIKFHGPEPPLIRIDAGMAKTGTVPRPARSDGGEATRSEGLSPVFADTETWGQGDAGTTSAVRSSADVRPGFVTIRVSDNGIGIDPKYADRIFGLFKRLHSEKEYPGTGIGLAVCKKIVERHGGTIRVESEPGRGSTFIFTLPAAGRESP